MPTRKSRIGPPNDAHSGAGLLFRAQVDQPDCYAFVLNPGNNVTLAQTDAGGMRFLWSREIPPVPSGEFVTLKVIGQGSAMDLYVNDQHYHTASNLKLSGGVPGIIALSIGNFTFDDFILYQCVLGE